MEQDLRGLMDPDEKFVGCPDCIGNQEGFKEGGHIVVDP